jgi:hypothetical protein
MKLRFPPTRYRVVRDNSRGYEAQFKVWWLPLWIQCSPSSGSAGVNSCISLNDARILCVKHHKRRATMAQARSQAGQIVAQFSARELEAQQ